MTVKYAKSWTEEPKITIERALEICKKYYDTPAINYCDQGFLVYDKWYPTRTNHEECEAETLNELIRKVKENANNRA